MLISFLKHLFDTTAQKLLSPRSTRLKSQIFPVLERFDKIIILNSPVSYYQNIIEISSHLHHSKLNSDGIGYIKCPFRHNFITYSSTYASLLTRFACLFLIKVLPEERVRPTKSFMCNCHFMNIYNAVVWLISLTMFCLI